WLVTVGGVALTAGFVRALTMAFRLTTGGAATAAECAKIIRPVEPKPEAESISRRERISNVAVRRRPRIAGVRGASQPSHERTAARFMSQSICAVAGGSPGCH